MNATPASPELRDRALALEIRAGRCGFAVFEASELVDWGTHRYSAANSARVRSVIVSLLTLSRPAVVVTRHPRKSSHASSGRARFVWRTIVMAVQRRDVPVAVVRRKDAKRYFAARGCRSKNDVARWLITRFPPLAWRLPPKRKLWQREAHSVVIFDAAATAVASGLLPIPA